MTLTLTLPSARGFCVFFQTARGYEAVFRAANGTGTQFWCGLRLQTPPITAPPDPKLTLTLTLTLTLEQYPNPNPNPKLFLN